MLYLPESHLFCHCSFIYVQQQRERNLRVFDLDVFMNRLSKGSDVVSKT